MTHARRFLSQALLLLLSPLAVQAAVLNDYCVVPPFIQEIAKPNLLMIIDNSASMYDLAYVDKGKKVCSGDNATSCESDDTCAAAGKGTCTVFQRQPYYCYDQTYSTANSYVGYFDPAKKYQYDFAAQQFVEVDAIPASCAVAASATVVCKIRPDVVHVNIGKGASAGTKYFYASGKYLNWITASKFDVEKQVLTGGKYVSKVCSNDSDKACLVDAQCGTGNTCGASSTFLQPESRGCVGQGYVKEALTSDFVNYSTDVGNTNTSLQVAFSVQGPANPFNPSAPASGGQTYINVFGGKDYDFGKCQDAIDTVADPLATNASIKQTVAACLASSQPTTGFCQQKTTQGCTTSPECVLNTLLTTTQKVCSLANTLSCTTDANCSLPATTTCSGNASRVCGVNSDCVINIAEKLGTCGSYTPKLSQGATNQVPATCRTNTDCNVSHGNTSYTGVCSGYAAASTTDYGTCVSTPAQNFGTCVPNYTGPCVLGDAETRTKVAFQQSLQACWQANKGTAIGVDDINTVINHCSDIYGNYYTCSNNRQQTCGGVSDATTCGAGTCKGGPLAIGAGSPALLCGMGYEGQFFEQNSAGAWVLKAGYDKTSVEMKDKHAEFCGALNRPVVTDPTDSPSDTATAENLPAILSGIGLESQMGAPLATLRARIAKATPPTGLVQEYQKKIRIGMMAFNEFGSKTEVENTPPLLPATKTCSNAPEKQCADPIDCGPGATCDTPTNNLDGAKVLSLIGKGKCSVTTGTACTKSAHCPNGETCVSDGAGTHSTPGLVSSIDSLRAATWTPFAEAFYNAIGYFAVNGATGSRTDLRINSGTLLDADDGDFPDSKNPSEYVCQSNNILLVTDGSSTADRNAAKGEVVNTYKSVSGNVTGTCPKYAGSKDLDDLAWIARHRNINTFERLSASTASPQKKNQSIASYIVFNGADNGEADQCNNVTLLTKTANNGGTDLLRADIPSQYQTTLRKAFEAVAGGTASGTAASILSNSEGSGANILQAVFYPSKDFETPTGEVTPSYAKWIGEMQNLWYFVDPFIGNSTVREDTLKPDSKVQLDIVGDYVVDFQFRGGETLAFLQKDTNGDGSGDQVVTNAADSRVKSQGFCTNTTTPTSSSYAKCATDAGCSNGETCVVQGVVNADDVNSLWRAGKKLWERNLDTTQRKLYTYLYGTSAAGCSGTFSVSGLFDLAAINWATIGADDKCILKSILQAGSDAEAEDIIKFAEGYDHADYDTATGAISGTIDGKKPRKRTVQIGGSKKVWKLADIIASTPRIQSFNKLNNYQMDAPAGYGDTTYANDSAKTGFTNSTAYKSRGMAYAGANDGMLHAFRLGTLKVTGTGGVKATLEGSDLGREEWAFLPKHVLPYLKYLADPDYSHIYLVDGPTRLLDASIGADYAGAEAPYTTAGCNATDKQYWACKRDGATANNKSWRSILIGSMGIGGATANLGAVCTNCVKAPVANVGYSSYFALDITDPNNPTYLWEFSHEHLGAATSGPAVVRIGHTFNGAGGVYGKEGSTPTNGRWFAVLGNGPSGPIDTTYHQFKGKSANPLRVFLLDLKTGSLLRDPIATSPLITNAFAGSMNPGPIDTDRKSRTDAGFYSDDAVYFGYSNCTANCDTDAPTWNGGIMRLLTNDSSDVNTWTLSTLVSNIGPVTTAISKLQDRKNHNLWLYTGSGRYYFKGDDSDNPGKIFAVKEPCYDPVNDDIYKKSVIDAQSPKCSAEITFAASDFANQTSAINSLSDKKGWYINLAAQDNVNNYGSERVITEPVAMPNGAVFFTSFMPSTDVCNYGGNSYMWGVRYDTGGEAAASQLKGKALVQVSTGSFEEVDLSTAFTSNLNRRMGVPMVGKPPTDPPPIVSSSGNKPLKRILHLQEK